jgi:hypothetical protein
MERFQEPGGTKLKAAVTVGKDRRSENCKYLK